MSRLEASVPEMRMAQMNHFEQELGLSKSQIVDEALSLFFKTIMETKAGWRIAFVDPHSPQHLREFTSPALTQVEWSVQRERLVLSEEAFARAQRLSENPPGPTPYLKEAVAQRNKRLKEGRGGRELESKKPAAK